MQNKEAREGIVTMTRLYQGLPLLRKPLEKFSCIFEEKR